MRGATLSTPTELERKITTGSDRCTRASTTSSGVASTAVPHVPDVRTITRFSKCFNQQITNNRDEDRSIRQPRNRKLAFECTRGRVGVSVRSKGRTDGKSVCRKHLFHTACNKHDWTWTAPWHVFQLCVTTLQMTMTTTHLGNVIEQTSGDPCAMARVPTNQATHAPRTKTGDFKMESQRQESQTMNHLKSRTKPPDTRPNLNHWCKSMTRTENHVPLKSQTQRRDTQPDPQPESPVKTNDQNTKPDAINRRYIQATNRQTNEIHKSYDTPPDKFETSSSPPRNVRNVCIGRVPLSRTAPMRNFDGDMSVPIRYLAQPVRRGNATHQSHGRRDVCRTGVKRATTIRGGVSIADARSDR